MSLDVWLRKGEKVQIGGRELILMPLPLSRLVEIGHWLEENCNEVVQDVIEELRGGKEAPNPLGLVTKVLLKVNTSQVAMEIFARSRKPGTKELLNTDLTVEFFEEYLDTPAAQELFRKFIKVNQLEDLIKNLWSLPIVKKVIEAGALVYGIPFLSSLQQSTDSVQSKSEGSHSHKSMDTSQPATSDEQEAGTSPSQNLINQAQPDQQLLKKEYVQ